MCDGPFAILIRGPLWVSVRALLASDDVFYMRTTAVKWNIAGLYAPFAELFDGKERPRPPYDFRQIFGFNSGALRSGLFPDVQNSLLDSSGLLGSHRVIGCWKRLLQLSVCVPGQ